MADNYHTFVYQQKQMQKLKIGKKKMVTNAEEMLRVEKSNNIDVLM